MDYEIESIKRVIRSLQKCLCIHLQNEQEQGAIQCLDDIKFCRNELKKIKIIAHLTKTEPMKNASK